MSDIVPARKVLYDYQEKALEIIFARIHEFPTNYNLCFQLPTGGGKTVIFSEIARRYIQETGKKVLILTHRIELLSQTSNVLNNFSVKNKIIVSKVKQLPDESDYECNRRGFEGLNNNYYFFTPAGNEILVRTNLRFFPTGRIIPLIPQDKRSFRYDTYVEGNTSTQTDGLLGLLDEFNSYAHSLATAYALKSSFMEIPGMELRHYITWRQEMHSYVQSYYEFKYFILHYLLFAKTNERTLYSEIKNSPDLMLAISTINSDFLKVVDQFNQEDQITGPAYWRKKGYSVLKDPVTGYENYKLGGSTIGYGCKMDDRDKLLPEINSSKFNEIKAEFSIR